MKTTMSEPIKIHFLKQSDYWLCLLPSFYKMHYKKDDIERVIEGICGYCLNRPGFLRNEGDEIKDYNDTKKYLVNEILSLKNGEEAEIGITIDLSFEKFTQK